MRVARPTINWYKSAVNTTTVTFNDSNGDPYDLSGFDSFKVVHYSSYSSTPVQELTFTRVDNVFTVEPDSAELAEFKQGVNVIEFQFINDSKDLPNVFISINIELATAFSGSTNNTSATATISSDSVTVEITEASVSGKSLANAINSAESKTPVNADKFGFWDSVSTDLRSVTWSTIKSTLKTYFDSVTQTLTNKTIDADNNTLSNLAHGEEVDSPSSGVHGVTGDIVGTTDTQTLTNKAFGDNLDMDSNKIVNVSNPTSNQDASNKIYTDGSLERSLIDYDFGTINISSQWVSSTSGSSSISYNQRATVVRTGGTSGSSASLGLPDATGFGVSNPESQFNFTKKLHLSTKLTVVATSTNTKCYFYFGSKFDDAVGDPLRDGFGFVIENTSVKGVYFSSSTAKTVDLSTSITTGQSNKYNAVSENGDITWYFNGVEVGSVSDGSTSISSRPSTRFAVANNADSNDSIMRLHSLNYYTEL